MPSLNRIIALSATLATAMAVTCLPASAATLSAGEYTCAGSSGILIGLGFRLRGNGTYTDLDGTTNGRVAYSGNTVSFVGGHLAGQVGRNVTSTNFDLGSASCSRN